MLHTAFDPASGRCLVEFRLQPEVGVERAWLAGDFNDWSTTATPMVRREDGSLSVTISLEPGRSHRFRYYFGDGRWENDWAADAYVDNHHGGADSVVVTPPPPFASPPPPITEPGEARPAEPVADAPADAGRETAMAEAEPVEAAEGVETGPAAREGDAAPEPEPERRTGVAASERNRAEPGRPGPDGTAEVGRDGAAGGAYEPAGPALGGRSGYLVVSRWRRLAAMGLLLAGGAVALRGRHRVVRRRH